MTQQTFRKKLFVVWKNLPEVDEDEQCYNEEYERDRTQYEINIPQPGSNTLVYQAKSLQLKAMVMHIDVFK